jgi:short-subunit dehydrogenase
MPTALVTGATAGIGHEFARQLAAQGHDLVLVARDLGRLERVAEELRSRYGAHVETLAADLSDGAGLQAAADRVADGDRSVDLLVNNAGFALRGRFLQNDIADEERHLDVLVRAVLVLSHAAGRAMVARGRGRIVNVSSVAGFIASGTYSAAKAWVTTFTEGLASELAGTGVTATALCPGFTHTEFHERAGLPKQGPRFMWLDPAQLVADCLAEVDRGRDVSEPGQQYKAIVGLLRVVPRSLVRSRVRTVRRPGPGSR